jgi:hypothetical protein
MVNRAINRQSSIDNHSTVTQSPIINHHFLSPNTLDFSVGAVEPATGTKTPAAVES